jgi:hypothetical protein
MRVFRSKGPDVTGENCIMSSMCSIRQIIATIKVDETSRSCITRRKEGYLRFGRKH